MSAPVVSATSLARSITRCVSVTWLSTMGRSPASGGLEMAISMHRTVSLMWMNARVCPPVPCTVSGWPIAACIRNRLSTVP